jgi:hypothetical protein
VGTEEHKRFWNNVLKAAEADPRTENSIRGASGIYHSALAFGVDEDRKRLLIISAEHDARTAAMAQIDIQAALNGVQVLVARPIAIDLSKVAQSISESLGRSVFTHEDITALSANSEAAGEAVKRHFDAVITPLNFLGQIPLNILAQWMSAVQQLGLITFSQFTDQKAPNNNRLTIDIDKLAKLDPLEQDNHFGVCPVPLYQFKPEEVDLLNGEPNLDDVRELLSRRGILQYFFPAADSLALGLIERGAGSQSILADQLVLAPAMGHPFGASEIVGEGKADLPSMIDALQTRNLIVDGEVGLEIGPDGRHIRTSIRFSAARGSGIEDHQSLFVQPRLEGVIGEVSAIPRMFPAFPLSSLPTPHWQLAHEQREHNRFLRARLS